MSTLVLHTLEEASLRAALLALLTAAALAGLRVRSSTLRHSAWTAVLGAMLLMPALLPVVPRILIPVPVRGIPDGAADRSRAAWTGFEHDPGETSRREKRALARTPISPTDSAVTAISSGVRAVQAPPRAYHVVRRSILADATLLLYGSGCLIMSARFLIGWRRAAALAKRARLVHLANRYVTPADRTIRVAESADVAAPVTVGVLTPLILLPANWREWPDVNLRAIVAHEFAHIARRDSLVSVLAQINRCVFWFHPLAWWLPRVLSRHAEQACDGRGVAAAGSAREYARILIDIARAVRDSGGRVPCHGVGIASDLARRIDCLVDGDIRSRVSPARAALVASTCVAAVAIAAACRPYSTLAVNAIDESIEQRDHKLRADLRRLRSETGRDIGSIDWDTAAARIGALQAALRQDPDNLEATRALLLAYWVHPDAARRRAHILRLIERHPDAPLAGSIEARLFASDRRPGGPFAQLHAPTVSLGGDPEGYEQAKHIWLAHTSRPDATPAVLGNAASFFESNDKVSAEQLLVRARALDPEGPWSARLGQFYATALVGAEMRAAKNAIRTVTAGEPRSGFGLAVRRMLGQSTDDVLLTATGWFLARNGRGDANDPLAWAEACFKRALQVNPHAVLAHTELLRVRAQARNRGEPLWHVPPALQYDVVAALPDAERFEQLPGLSRGSIMALGDLARWDDPNLRDRREIARDQARRYAEDALRLAPKFRGHPRVGIAIYTAQMTLGALALQDGDRRAAVGFLQAASAAPRSEELVYADNLVSDLHWHLAGDLLKAGERQPVAQFLERMAGLNLAHRTELLEAAAAIRRGETPRL